MLGTDQWIGVAKRSDLLSAYGSKACRQKWVSLAKKARAEQRAAEERGESLELPQWLSECAAADRREKPKLSGAARRKLKDKKGQQSAGFSAGALFGF